MDLDADPRCPHAIRVLDFDPEKHEHPVYVGGDDLIPLDELEIMVYDKPQPKTLEEVIKDCLLPDDVPGFAATTAPEIATALREAFPELKDK